VKEETNLKESTYKINNYEEKIVVESNSLLNIELNNFPPESVSWKFNEINSDEIIEYKGKENRNTCTETSNNSCEDVTIFKFQLKDLTNSLLPTLEFIMVEKETGEPKSSVFVEMKLKEKNPPKEFVYKVGRENTEVLIEPNSLLLIELGNDATSVQEQYTIFNSDEVYKTGFIEYIGVNYRSNCNTISIDPRKTECGETSIFTFKINKISKDSILPTIKFTFQNMTSFPYSENTFNVALKLDENATIIDEPEIIPTEYTYQIKEDTELIVSKNSLIKIELDVDISNGYEWLISNSQIIERTGLIEIIGNNYNYCGDKKSCIPTVTFTFLIKEIDSDDVLPNIKLTLEDMRLWKPTRTITITLKQEEEKVESQKNSEVELEKFTYKIEEATEVTVEPNSLLILELEHKSISSQYQWNLQNMNEILQTGLIEFQKVDYNSNNEVFTFVIKDVIDERLLPTIRFINVNMMMSNYSTDILEVTLKLANSDITDENLEEYIYEINNDSEIIVESNSLVTLELSINLAMGYEWSITNYDELKTSGLIDFYGTQYSAITEKMWFRIKEVNDKSTLPKIKLSYTNKSVSSTSNIFKKSIEVSLKLKEDKKNSVEKVCSFKDYPCCTKSDAKVYYHDKDGDWGVENGNWCIIMEKQDPSTTKTTTTTTTTATTTISSTATSECFSLKLGYPCCQSNDPKDIIYTDSDGDWGKENHQWCGISIPTCQPKNGYPVCEKTKKVVYTDTDEWGVEHGQWCIICN